MASPPPHPPTVTGTESEAAAYEFTTLTCIPGVIHYKGTKIQLLDLPGIIEGAASGKGRGRQVIAVAKSADLVLMFLDATKPDAHRAQLELEMESAMIRLNQDPPDIYFKRKKTGGIKFNNSVPLTKMGANRACPGFFFKSRSGLCVCETSQASFSSYSTNRFLLPSLTAADTVYRILQEYRIHNCEVVFRGDYR